MLIAILVIVYLIISALGYNFVFKKWDNPTWENIMISLSWICVIPLWGIRKLQELSNG